MVAQGFTVDLNKPLVFQIIRHGFINPSLAKTIRDSSQMIFWSMVGDSGLMVLPVVFYFITQSVILGHNLPDAFVMIVTGIFIWTLVEYILDRFIFHIKTRSYWGNTAHYLLHGCHHKHPMDGLRLVFPPTATAILCIPLYNVVLLCSTPTTAPAIFGGQIAWLRDVRLHALLSTSWTTLEIPRLSSQKISF